MGKGKRNLDVEEEGLMLGPFRIESHRTWEKSESHALYFSAFGVQFFPPTPTVWKYSVIQASLEKRSNLGSD